MKFEIVHSTRYRYTAPIAETVMEVKLQPMDGNGQRCLDFRLELSHGIKARTYIDGFGNHVHYFNLVRPHAGLSVISRSTVETGLDLTEDPGEELVQDFLRFRSPVKDIEGVRELARRHRMDPTSPASVEQALDELTHTISREFTYDTAVTNVYSVVDDVLTLKAGVCQDFAHLLIAVARAMGVPARYVSGYIHLPKWGNKATTASHAWAEAWVAGRGWIGFDATHPVRTTPHHVRLAVGRDYTDAAPTRGVYVGSAGSTMSISVKTRALS